MQKIESVYAIYFTYRYFRDVGLGGEIHESLKEKLPQAFMQIGWMEDDFRNPTAKVWANLDNPTKRDDFSKVSLILCMSPSQVALF